MSVGAVPIIDDEEDNRPLPAATVPPVAPEDIKVTPGAGAPAGDATPSLAPDISKAIDDAVASASPPTSSPADLAAAIAAPSATNPLAAAPPIPSLAPTPMFPNGTMHIKREVPGAADPAALDAIEQGRNRDLQSVQDQKNALADDHVEAQAQLQKDIDDKAKAAEEKARRQEELQKTVDAKVAEQQKAFDDYKATPFRDLYAERSMGERIFGALAVFLGGAGGRHNDALDILNAGMQHAYDKQAADIAGKWKVYEKATGDVAGAKTGMHQAMLDLDTLQAARWEVNAAELQKMKEKQGMTAEQAKLAVQETGINDRADQAKQKVVEGAKYLVDESNLRPDRGKKHGAGGGGGAMASAAEQLAHAIREGVTDENGVRRPLSQEEKIHAANALHVPLEGKAGQITLNTVTKESTFESDQDRKNKKGGAGGGDSSIVRDENGSPIGRVPSGRGGAVGFATRDSDYARAVKVLEELRDDIKVNGDRVVGNAERKRRNGLYAGAVGAVAGTSPLGKTIEAQHLEQKNIGPSGAGGEEHGILGALGSVITGASLENVERKIQEVKENRERYRRETLTPMTEDEIAAARSRGQSNGAPAQRTPEQKKAAALAIWNDKKKLGTMTPAEQSRIALLAGVAK